MRIVFETKNYFFFAKTFMLKCNNTFSLKIVTHTHNEMNHKTLLCVQYFLV